ncbi:ribonuclease H family protein [Nocardia cyriacigeorgica]|uniref:ribonuclease H n=1 Tax=Nocardia cyriacigeorgica TaxID=135487 RepID=A0A6P1D2G2_9NOCA|nr:ribonuclease H [Nocardia cyriacigeorgica]NEW43611.1 ribonuclease HI [Nocardia cyriacigeorgica]
MIIVSTDGSCLRNPGGAIGWAWVNHQGPADSGGAASGTNQIAELRALLEAILAHPSDEPLLIESDSLYAIKCASEWIAGWRRNGWRTSTGGAVKNAELIQRIDRAIASRPGPVRFRWVRGHVGNYFNEQADTLAGQAARRVAADPTTGEPATVDPATVEPSTVEIPAMRASIPAPKRPDKPLRSEKPAATRKIAKQPAAGALTLF